MVTESVCLKKCIRVKIILENLIQKKKTKHTPSGCSIFTRCSFDPTKNKLDYYKDEDYMEMFCKDLREHATEIINYEKKEMIPLTNEENESYKKQKVFIYAKKNLVPMMMTTMKITIKSEIIVIIQENLEGLLIVFAI